MARAARRAILLVLCAAALGAALPLAGCGGWPEPETAERREPQRRPGQEPAREPTPRPQTVEPARCPAEVAECAEAEGRVVYVEAVDPDGDGDAHFVILDAQSITLPGFTAIDVEKSLRPEPLPGVGDLVSAAGPVQTGSYDQSQIHALEFNVAR